LVEVKRMYDETNGGRFHLRVDAVGKVWKIPTDKAIREERMKSDIIRYGSLEAAEQAKRERIAGLRARVGR
jgi:hypothetical protein